MEKYRPIVRPTILYALLAYMFYAGALLLDLGRPWHIVNPIIGNSFGISAVLFLIAWKFILYMGSLFTEFFPTIGEWAGLKRQRRFFGSLTLAVVIFGITLSTIHQSGLGALFLMAKPKIHPLWYSELIPLLFFISSIFAGLSLVIVLESISQKAFSNRMSFLNKSTHLPIMFGLARTNTITMFVYFFMSIMVIIQDRSISYLNTSWGAWYMVEMAGFVLVPCMLFLFGYRRMNINMVRAAAVMTIIGIILNRLNISTIAFKWYEGAIHLPNVNEIIVSAAVILVQIQMFRWIARRMPVYAESPSWVSEETRFKRYKTDEKSYKLNTKSKKWRTSAG
jgi:Ni/Fe-hydrogenase subunit HybB-like protein